MQVETLGYGCLAKLDVPTGCVDYPHDLTNVSRRHDCQLLLEFILNGMLNAVFKLGARGGEKLDSIIVIRIVRGTDDNTCIGTVSSQSSSS